MCIQIFDYSFVLDCRKSMIILDYYLSIVGLTVSLVSGGFSFILHLNLLVYSSNYSRYFKDQRVRDRMFPIFALLADFIQQSFNVINNSYRKDALTRGKKKFGIIVYN